MFLDVSMETFRLWFLEEKSKRFMRLFFNIKVRTLFEVEIRELRRKSVCVLCLLEELRSWRYLKLKPKADLL